MFSGKTGLLIESFYAFNPAFRGGVTVGSADFTGDGKSEIIVGAASGADSHVEIFDMATHAVIAGPLGSFMAFDASVAGGVSVASDLLAGDVTGDTIPDLAVGSGPGSASRVKVYDGATGAVVADFSPYGADASGVRVAMAYVDDDAHADIIVGNGPGAQSRVKVFSGLTFAELPAPIGSIAPFGADYSGGLFIAGSNDPHGTYGMGGNPGPSVVLNGSVSLSQTINDALSSDGVQIPTGTITFGYAVGAYQGTGFTSLGVVT